MTTHSGAKLMQLTLLRSFVYELVQAEEVRLRRAVNVVPPDQAETIHPHVKFFNIHQSQTKYCWLKMVPFGQRNAVERPFSSHI